MKSRANTLFTLVLAGGLALFTFWLERIVNAPGPGQTGSARHEPDFIVEQLTATDLDLNGRPDSTLTARIMRHYPDDQTTELDSPRLVQLRPGRPPLHIEADRGKAFKDSNEVQLFGNVIVRRAATATQAELRMDTEYLQVFPKEEAARTHEYVVIQEGRSRLTGVGMDYDNKTRQLELKSRVTGTYLPDEG